LDHLDSTQRPYSEGCYPPGINCYTPPGSGIAVDAAAY
jgi:hypothetical protein